MRDLCANPRPTRQGARELSVAERDALGLLEVRWIDATPVLGKLTTEQKQRVAFETWKRVA